MKYLFETEAKNYEDFASGRVLYNRKGATAFPVRLGSEIVQRCLAHIRRVGRHGPFTLYDPCCGGAYLLTTIALLHGKEFALLMASDIDGEMLELARDNLSLLTLSGMERRIAQINDDLRLYGKDSHREALASAERIKELVKRLCHLTVRCWQADILKPGILEAVPPGTVDIVITDVPYGSIASWSQEVQDPISVMLGNLRPVLSDQAVVALVTPNRQRFRTEGYSKLEGFRIGKRAVVLLARND
ncbi:MAG: hypothetical protein GX195_03060 [Firmicutes bacterium]|jgi:tRNA G10  N-methylase Trm11|nr:hypothetical protein [Bacillota bacterium]